MAWGTVGGFEDAIAVQFVLQHRHISFWQAVAQALDFALSQIAVGENPVRREEKNLQLVLALKKAGRWNVGDARSQ